MLGPLVLNGVGGQINGTDIVTVHNGGSPKRAMDLMEELTQPTRLHNSICDSAILGLCTGSRDCRLTLGRPGNQIITQKYTVARSGTASIGTTGPISISVHSEISSRGAKKVKPKVQGTLNVAQNALHGGEVWLSRIMHIKTDLLNGVGEIRAREGEVLKHASNAVKMCRISH